MKVAHTTATQNPIAQSNGLSVALADRLRVAEAHAHAALARVIPDPHADALLRAAHAAPTTTKRVTWLRKAANAWAGPLEKVSACKRGCSHCCHIAVAVTDQEARMIGKAVGVAPARVDEAVPTERALEAGDVLPGTPSADYSSPCPFLQGGECSIYEVRPIACRTQLNLDVDDLLCRLVPGAEIPVPYADATLLKAAYVMLQPGARWADVRAFFPRGKARNG